LTAPEPGILRELMVEGVGCASHLTYPLPVRNQFTVARKDSLKIL